VHAVIAPPDKDDPHDAVRPPENRNKHGGFDERVWDGIHVGESDGGNRIDTEAQADGRFKRETRRTIVFSSSFTA
jgi:hypothetical protein